LSHVSYDIRADEPGPWFVPDFSHRLMSYGFGREILPRMIYLQLPFT